MEFIIMWERKVYIYDTDVLVSVVYFYTHDSHLLSFDINDILSFDTKYFFFCLRWEENNKFSYLVSGK